MAGGVALTASAGLSTGGSGPLTRIEAAAFLTLGSDVAFPAPIIAKVAKTAKRIGMCRRVRAIMRRRLRADDRCEEWTEEPPLPAEPWSTPRVGRVHPEGSARLAVRCRRSRPARPLVRDKPSVSARGSYGRPPSCRGCSRPSWARTSVPPSSPNPPARGSWQPRRYSTTNHWTHPPIDRVCDHPSFAERSCDVREARSRPLEDRDRLSRARHAPSRSWTP